MPAMTSSNSGNAKRSDTRSRLLHSAVEVFADYGFEGASLRAIAERAGVAYQSITYHFGNKEDLWAAIVEDLFQRFMETGRGLAFDPSGNLEQQFRNHLRLLLSDLLQRPQMRRVFVQEYLSGSGRFETTIKPRIKSYYRNLSLPYFNEAARLGIIKTFTGAEASLLFLYVTTTNIFDPYQVELRTGIPMGSARSIERQVDLIVDILTRGSPEDQAVASETERTRDGAPYRWHNVWGEGDAQRPLRQRQMQVEILRLKQLVGELTLENKLLLDRLKASDRRAEHVPAR
jgi:AcrR family transcriptional regulator